jgi:hypothetical protein
MAFDLAAAFGPVATAPDQHSIRAVEGFLNLLCWIPDPQKMAAQIQEFHEDLAKFEVARAEHNRREQALQKREAAVTERESRVMQPASQKEVSA